MRIASALKQEHLCIHTLEKSRTLLEKLRLDMQRNYHLLFTFGLAPRHHTPSAEDATDLSAVQNIYIALFCGNENISESCG